jgi:hypothetical protein
MIRLRDVETGDLAFFFEHQRDPVAVAMVAFQSRDADAFAGPDGDELAAVDTVAFLSGHVDNQACPGNLNALSIQVPIRIFRLRKERRPSLTRTWEGAADFCGRAFMRWRQASRRRWEGRIKKEAVTRNAARKGEAGLSNA